LAERVTIIMITGLGQAQLLEKPRELASSPANERRVLFMYYTIVSAG